MKLVKAVIIAGGQSSRMGRDKGLLEWNEKPLVQYVIEAVAPLVKQIVIITQNHLYKRFGFEIFPDLLPGLGPAGGIYTALHASDAETNFILSCDIPNITTGTLEYLLHHHKASEISVAKHGERIEPLIGIYEKRSLEKWNQLLEQNETAMHTILQNFKVQYVEMENYSAFNENEFMNINTPSDVLKLNT